MPLLSVLSLKVTLRMGKWMGTDPGGEQVGREVVVDEAPNEG